MAKVVLGGQNGNEFVHKRVAQAHEAHVKTILGTSTSAAVGFTAATTNAVVGGAAGKPFTTTVGIATATGSSWGVLTQAYSYDGVIHLEAFRSDV